MRKSISILAGLLCVVACSQRIELPEPESKTETVARATIIADSPSYSKSPSTRTEIYTITTDDDKEEIHTYWSAPDGLRVPFCADGMTTQPGNEYFESTVFVSNNSQPSQTATFEANGPNPPDGYTYYAIHPSSGTFRFGYYQGADNKYYSSFDYYLPVEQHPGAQTFDNAADLLVSESFSFDSDHIVDGLAFTRMNAIVKINFVDKTTGSQLDKKGINAVTFGPENGNKYLTGCSFVRPHDEQYGFYLPLYMAAYPEYYDEIMAEFPAYPYVSAAYNSGDCPVIGTSNAVYLIVHPTVLMESDYQDGFPIQVEFDDYLVTRYITIPEGGIDLTAGLVTTLNISLWDDGVKGTTIVEKQEIEFADPLVRSICLEYYDFNGDGHLDTGEASRVTSLFVEESSGPDPKKGSSGGYSPFAYSGITSFNELQFFTGLEEIETEAFAGCESLTSITIPISVTTIREHAFSNSGLVSVTIPNSVTTVEEGAFCNCLDLTSFKGKFASSDYKYLVCDGMLIAVALPNLSGSYLIPSDLGITGIGARAFEERTSLTSVTIPSGVSYIGTAAFEGCTGLTTVLLPNTIRTLDYQAFCWCSSLESINLPNGLQTIGSNAFSNCDSLESIVIPGSVTSMGNLAFGYCDGLTSVTLSEGMTSPFTGDAEFRNCSNLTDVSLPSTLTTIGYLSFQYCTSLSSITIPVSVTLINHQAFQNCSELQVVTLEPETPPTLGNNVFNNTHKNLHFYVPQGTASIYKKDSYWSRYFDMISEVSEL